MAVEPARASGPGLQQSDGDQEEGGGGAQVRPGASRQRCPARRGGALRGRGGLQARSSWHSLHSLGCTAFQRSPSDLAASTHCGCAWQAMMLMLTSLCRWEAREAAPWGRRLDVMRGLGARNPTTQRHTPRASALPRQRWRPHVAATAAFSGRGGGRRRCNALLLQRCWLLVTHRMVRLRMLAQLAGTGPVRLV
jgi:hypothetical protein